MRHGVDFAYGSPGRDGAALAAEGLFVGRYVPYLGDQGKGLRADELADYRAHGVDLFLFFQTTADFMRGGSAHGALHAQWCLAAAANLGLDDSGAFYFACDFDIQPSEYGIVADYLRGVATVLPKRRIGLYGHDRICRHIFGLGLAHYFCQCVAWSGGRVFANRNLFQATPDVAWNGHLACREEAYTEDFGQWAAMEGEVTKAELDALTARIEDLELAAYSGSEDAALTRTERLANARAYIAEAVTGDVNNGKRSLSQRIENGIAMAAGKVVAEHTHEPGRVTK